MQKLNILATTCYSGTSQLTETAQTGQGLYTFCLSSKIFDTNTGEEKTTLREFVLDRNIRAVIFDNCWLPGKVPGISHGQIDFARELYTLEIESFFLCRTSDPHNNLGCELWRAHKPIQYHDMAGPALHLACVGVFMGSEVFDMQTGKVYTTSGGDGGWAQVQHAVREYRAFHERDWPKIVEVVKKELAL